MPLTGKRVVIIGGSAGMGYATAAAALAAGAHVTIAARSADKLDTARAALGNKNVESAVLDATDETAVRKFFEQCEGVDHVVTSAAVVNRQPFFEVSAEAAHAAFESKFW